MKKYETTQVFRVNRSELLLYGLVFLHALSLLAVLLSDIAIASKILLVIAVFLSLYLYCKKELYFNHVLIRFSPDYGWAFAERDADFMPISLLPSTIINPYLLILHFKTDKSKIKTILILSDSMNTIDFRKLLVTIKITGLNQTEI